MTSNDAKRKSRGCRAACCLLALLAGAAGGEARAATDVSGSVSGEWTAAGSPYTVTADAGVLPEASLVIGPGVAVGFAPGVSLVVQGSLEVRGAAGAGVKFVRSQADTAWGGVAFTGATAQGLVQYLEITGATIVQSTLPGFPTDFPAVFKITNGAKVRVENCWFHDFPNKCVDNGGGGELRIYDTLIENCMESIHSAASFADIQRVHIRHVFGYSDFVDFDGDSTPHSIIRDCLFEDNVEEDGIDTMETNCLIENLVLKGVLGGKALDFEGKSTPVARNVIVIGAKFGLVSKDSCTAAVDHLTLIGCEAAVYCREKNPGRGGGHITGDSLIIWGNTKVLDLDAKSTFETTYSDVQGGYDGIGNIDMDPLFVNPAADDYHLGAASPAIGTGKDGTDMGAYPYTGPPVALFIRGDVNLDSQVDISDALFVLLHLFAGLHAPCEDAANADSIEDVNVSDAIFLLEYLFRSGSAPGAPFPAAGPAPGTAPSLGCESGL